MAAILVPAITGNKCVGSYTDGSVLRKHFCKKGTDAQGDEIYTCATWRRFRVNCPKINFQCSSLSEAWVAAAVVCRQRLF
jgi:hypothetical protein